MLSLPRQETSPGVSLSFWLLLLRAVLLFICFHTSAAQELPLADNNISASNNNETNIASSNEQLGEQNNVFVELVEIETTLHANADAASHHREQDKDDNLPEFFRFFYVSSSSPNHPYNNASYRMRIMTPDCQSSLDTTTGILSVSFANSTTLRTAAADDAEFSDTATAKKLLIYHVNMNTKEIVNSPYWTSTNDGNSSGQLEFCTKVDLTGNQNLDDNTVSDVTHVTVHIDTTTPQETVQVVGIVAASSSRPKMNNNYSLGHSLVAFFCNRDGTTESPTRPRFPGQAIRICVQTDDQTEAAVQDIQSIVFVSARNHSLVIPLIDELGEPMEDRRSGMNSTYYDTEPSKSCNDGTCQMTTTTVRPLYEHDINGDGIYEDVTDNIWIEGTAIVAYPSSSSDAANNNNIFALRHRRRSLLQISPSSSSSSISDDNNTELVFDFALRVNLVHPPTTTTTDSRDQQTGNKMSPLTAMAVTAVCVLIASVIGVAFFGFYAYKYIFRGGVD